MSVAFEMKPIGTLCRVSGGKRIPKGRSLSDEDTGFKYLRLNDFSDRGISLEDMKFLPNDLSEALSRYRVAAGDIVISVAGTLGMTRKITADLDGAYLTENADRLSGFCGVLPDYILHVLSSEWQDKLIASSSTKSGQPKLALERIRSFQIPVPSAAEQQKIVEILSDCDVGIDNSAHRLLSLRAQYRVALNRLLDNSRFQTNARKLEALTYRPISYGVLKPSEYTPGGVPMMRIQDVDAEGNLITDPYLITKEQHLEYQRTELNEGDLICSLVGSIGRVLNVPKQYRGGNVSRAFAVIGINNPDIRQFVEHSLRASGFQKMIHQIATGNAQKVLNIGELKNFQISIPEDLATLREVNSALDNMMGQIGLAEKLQQSLITQKHGLMQQLLTGKLRVKGAA